MNITAAMRLAAAPFALATTTVLTACSTPGTNLNQAPTGGAAIATAAESPLVDLNLVQQKIPPVLLAAEKAPYAPPADRSCAGLATAIGALDTALGADLDAPSNAGDPGLVARGSSEAGEALTGAIRSTTESVIPFRGWIRKLDGAERHSREVLAAIAAGSVRRGYLKGIGETLGCQAPAAPRPAPAASVSAAAN